MLFLGGGARAQEAERPLLHPMFQDHAVIQRDRPIEVWGWARPGEHVRVRLDSGNLRTARAAPDGAWRLVLPPMRAGGPHAISVDAGDRTQVIHDVLAGDVFLCSGQSNMEFPTRSVTNSETILREAPRAQLRLFHISRDAASAPRSSFGAPASWALDSPEAASDFSAVCYLYGRSLQRSQNIPIGLISASWGGTPIESWMSGGMLREAGFGEEVALAELNAREPEAAEARFNARMSDWRRQHDRGLGERWEAPAFNDSAWLTISPERFWEDSGRAELARLDGVVWFRAEFTLNTEQAALGGEFRLGPADDIDATYLNGREIGGLAGWDTPRVYRIGPGLLREGRNVLAMSVIDTGGGGGFWGDAKEKVLRLQDGNEVSLSSPWRFRVAASLEEVEPPPRRQGEAQNAPAALYNAMISPIGRYGVRAALWYQGETNAGAPHAYARLLPALFRDWRRQLRNDGLEFYVVQLSAFGAPVITQPTRNGWGRIRDVQRRVVASDEHAALAVSIDLGDRYDVHPTQKLVVAERLARLARRRLYNEDIVESGPLPVRAARQGSRVVVEFAHGPLRVHSGGRPMSFELCTADRACRFVDALAQQEAVFLDDVGSNEVFVRHCWGDSPICNLFNEADLPASPFELEIE